LSPVPNGSPWGVSIDSRTIKPGELFFAISGDRFDGHNFIEPAMQNGACGAVLSRPVELPVGKFFIAVPDVRKALLDLAAACRKKWGGRLICITGSAGKTTTKERIADFLARRYRTHRSQGNFNNEIGLSLALLGLQASHQRAVVEIGMNRPGEIAALAAAAAPETGVLTCVAPVHLEFFASLDKIADAKAELISFLRSDGSLVYNLDDPLLVERAAVFEGRKVSFGFSDQADVRALRVQSKGLNGSAFEVSFGGEIYSGHTTLPGIHNIYNWLAAAATALAEGLPFRQIVQGKDHEPVVRHRGSILRMAAGFTVIDDSYNSNPKALESMLDLLRGTSEFQRRLVVAGEMRELGVSSAALHRQCGRNAALAGVDLLMGVAGDARYFLEGAEEAGLDHSRILWADSFREAIELLIPQIQAGDLVLIKGSRGVQLDRVVDALLTDFPLVAQEDDSEPEVQSC